MTQERRYAGGKYDSKSNPRDWGQPGVAHLASVYGHQVVGGVGGNHSLNPNNKFNFNNPDAVFELRQAVASFTGNLIASGNFSYRPRFRTKSDGSPLVLADIPDSVNSIALPAITIWGQRENVDETTAMDFGLGVHDDGRPPGRMDYAVIAAAASYDPQFLDTIGGQRALSPFARGHSLQLLKATGVVLGSGRLDVFSGADPLLPEWLDFNRTWRTSRKNQNRR